MYITDRFIDRLAMGVRGGLPWEDSAALLTMPKHEFLDLIIIGRKYPDSVPGQMVAALEKASLHYEAACQPGARNKQPSKKWLNVGNLSE